MVGGLRRYAAGDMGRRPIRHPVTGEELPETGQGKAVRLFPSQRAYLRSRIEALPAPQRSSKEDGVLRQIIDDEMRREFGENYETRARAFATEDPEPPPVRKRRGKKK